MSQQSARRRRQNFVERTLASLLGAVEQSLYAEELARTDGALQRLDARVKVLGLSALIVASACRTTWR